MPGYFRITKYSLCGLLVLLLLQAPVWASASRDLFDRGVAAFRNKDYASALQFFEKARSEGLDDNKLHYNLGVTYYKLGRFADANRAFRKIVNDPDMAQLASYNLGLVALKQDDNKQAAEWFTRARKISKSGKLAQLSAEQLRRLGYDIPVEGHVAYPGFAMVRGSLGYDDNVTLQADIFSASAANKGDSFAELFAYGNKQVAQFGNKVIQIEGSLFDIHYSALSNYDLDDLYLGAVLEDTLDQWTLDAGLSEDITFIGGSGLNRATTLQVAGERKIFDKSKLRLRYRLSRIDDLDAAYSYLNGWSHQFQIDSTSYVARYQIRLTYRFEYNDRNDLQAPLFTSYSPTRNTLRVRGLFPLANRLKTQIDLKYRNSSYHNASQQSDGSLITRNDDRYQAIVRVIYNLSKRADMTGEYAYTDNHSNIPIEQYKINQYQLSLTYLW